MVDWEDGELVQDAYVEVNGIRYPVIMPLYQGRTPVSAENLLKMQSDLQNQLDNKLFYKSGDILTFPGLVTFPGMITGDAQDIIFTVFTRKSLANISNITINNLNLAVRTPAGGYILNNGSDFSSYASIFNKFDGGFSVKLSNTSGWGVTNNTPISVSADNFKVTFS